MSFMRSSREFMMRVLTEIVIKKRQKIRFGKRAEEDDSSAVILQININKSDEIEYNIENMHN